MASIKQKLSYLEKKQSILKHSIIRDSAELVEMQIREWAMSITLR